MKIGEVATRLDIPSSTIRYYEKRGLLPAPERVSGKREFSESALATLRFIQLGQTAGFTIQELQVLLDRYKKGSTVDRVWEEDVETKRNEIRMKIAQLEQADVVLGKLMNCQCKTIEQCVSEEADESVYSVNGKGQPSCTN